MFKELGNLKFMLFVISMGFIMGGFFAYLGSSTFIIQEVYKLSYLDYSYIFAICSASIAITSFIAGKISNVIKPQTMIKSSYYLLIISSILLIICGIYKELSVLFVIIALIVNTSMLGTTQTPGFALAMSVVKGGKGSGSGIFGAMSFLFGSLFSSVVNIFENPTLGLGLILLLTAILSFIFFHLANKPLTKA